MYVHIYILYIYISFGTSSNYQYMCMYVCMYVWMDGWIYGCVEKSQINRVLNEICTQLGMLRCKFYVVVFLGETNTQNLCFLNMNFKKQENNTQHTHMLYIYTYLWEPQICKLFECCFFFWVLTRHPIFFVCSKTCCKYSFLFP